MADDRLSCCRLASISPTNCITVILRSAAISFTLFQNSSSTLTLVLRPAMTTERLKTKGGAQTLRQPASQRSFANFVKNSKVWVLRHTRQQAGAAVATLWGICFGSLDIVWRLHPKNRCKIVD